ncbi:unnamed protein product [Amoebophrya sp. A25]|nr:unnamed protein product [Amoebophrya sp. A25]|eukprot:GSA25T00017055001.1
MSQPRPKKHGHHTGREIIQIQVGKCGNAIGHEFWRDIAQEHRIAFEGTDQMNGRYTGEEGAIYQENLEVFFNEGSNGRYVPRAILVDTNMSDLAQITGDSLGRLYRPENIIGNDEGAGNCYAKAFHTEGPDLADQVLETVRKEVEKCECLQGVQFTHSICGGAGSGLTGLLLKTLYDYLDKGSKCILQSFTVVPSPGLTDVILEPYNAALGMQDLLEYCHQCFLYDNAALGQIVQNTCEVDTPKLSHLNNIVGLCMTGLTSCLRLPGILDADLRKMQTNLVPFKNAHFLCSSFAPLTSPANKEYRKFSVLDLAQQMISKDNFCIKCDPLNPGDAREGILKARFLASFAAFRGNIYSSEADQVIYNLQKHGSRFDHYFPDWIPNCISTSICAVPHETQGDSVTFVCNTTAVHEAFDRICANWDSLYKSRSYLYVYEQDGISTQDMMESRNILRYVSDQYQEFARWEDKFFDGSSGPDGGVILNEAAILNPEQETIAKELAELTDCYIATQGRA